MSHAPEKPTVLSVEASPEKQAQPARCALATGYALLLANLQAVARGNGYALAVHGSMRPPQLLAKTPEPIPVGL